MKLKIRFADQIVGLFVLIAIAAICAILILLGANQRWFAKDFYFSSEFKSGQGLREGMAIKMKGFQIGAVNEIILQEDNNVGIRFHIYDTYYEKITKNSVLELSVSPIGLGGGLVLYPGIPTGELIPEGEKIPSLDFAEGLKLIKLKLTEKPEGGDAINQILGSLGPLLNNVDNLVIDLRDTLTNVNQAIEGDTETKLGEILTEVAVLTGEVTTLITQVSSSLTSTLSNVDGITRNIDSMTADPTGLVTDLLAPEGSIATLLDDDNQLFDKINETIDDINGTISQLQLFTVYLNNTQPQITGILDDGQDALVKGKEVLEGLTNNPLLRGGITEEAEQGSTFQGYRDEDF